MERFRSVGDVAPWVLARCGDRNRFLIGVTGPPGSGKSTGAEALAEHLGPAAVVVPMDGFHLDNRLLLERGLLESKGAPETFDAWGFVALVRRLAAPAATESVLAPRFDRALDTSVAGSIAVETSDRFVIIEGNYLLLDTAPWTELSAVLDLVIYLDLDDDVRIERLVARHMQFGRSSPAARTFVMASDERNARLIQRGRGRADAVLTMTA